MNNNVRVFFALLRRDIRFIGHTLLKDLIDAGILCLLQVLVFGRLLPLLGMSIANVGPLYLVNICQILFLLGFNLAFNLVFDLKFDRFIQYHFTLPISKRWLFAQYVCSFMLKCITISLPLVSLGLFLLRDIILLSHANWLQFGIMYTTSMIFFALLFLTLSFKYEYKWFLDNIWPRRLSPLFLLSASFFPWYKVKAFSNFFGYLFLLNPITYIIEGFRTTLLGGNYYLPFWLCLSVLVCSIAGLIVLLTNAVYKRLNPV
ncbi:MAG: hypothetical protein ACOYT8_06275 [Candidatus Dependentiae bacterium]